MRSKDPKTGTACNRETCLLKLARSGLCVTISGIIELGHNYSGWCGTGTDLQISF